MSSTLEEIISLLEVIEHQIDALPATEETAGTIDSVRKKIKVQIKTLKDGLSNQQAKERMSSDTSFVKGVTQKLQTAAQQASSLGMKALKARQDLAAAKDKQEKQLKSKIQKGQEAIKGKIKELDAKVANEAKAASQAASGQGSAASPEFEALSEILDAVSGSVQSKQNELSIEDEMSAGFLKSIGSGIKKDVGNWQIKHITENTVMGKLLKMRHSIKQHGVASGVKTSIAHDIQRALASAGKDSKSFIGRHFFRALSRGMAGYRQKKILANANKFNDAKQREEYLAHALNELNTFGLGSMTINGKNLADEDKNSISIISKRLEKFARNSNDAGALYSVLGNAKAAARARQSIERKQRQEIQAASRASYRPSASLLSAGLPAAGTGKVGLSGIGRGIASFAKGAFNNVLAPAAVGLTVGRMPWLIPVYQKVGIIPRMAVGGEVRSTKDGIGTAVMLGDGKDSEIVTPMNDKIMSKLGGTIAAHIPGLGGSRDKPKGETAQQMEERQAAAADQHSIAKNVETIVQILQENQKNAKPQKKEGLLSQILGFLGMMATTFLPKILKVLRAVGKGIRFAGKLLRPLGKLVGFFGKGIGGFLGKIFGKGGFLGKIFGNGGFIGRLLGKAGPLGGIFKVLGTFGRVLGKLCLPLTAILGAVDAFNGWNDKDLHKRMFGLKDGEEATTGQKMKASTASVVSGLSMGLISPEQINKAMEHPLLKYGPLGLFYHGLPALTDFAEEFMNSKDKGAFIKEKLTKVKDAIFEKLGSVWDWIKENNPFNPLIDGLKSFGASIKEKLSNIGTFLEENNPFTLIGKGFDSVKAWVDEKKEKISALMDEYNPLKPLFGMFDSIKGFFANLSAVKIAKSILPEWLHRFLPEEEPVPPQSPIPKMAGGGFVHSSKEGTIAVIGEGGEDEAVMPLSKLARFVVEAFNIGMHSLEGGFGKAKGAFRKKGDGTEATAAERWKFELLDTIKTISKNVELLTDMIKLIKVDGVTLGELVKRQFPQPGGPAGAVARAAQAAAGGAGGAGAPGGGGGGSGDVQPIPAGPAQLGADGFLSMADMGSLAGKYESEGKSTTTVDNGDNAGTSFGKYQIAGVGRRKEFLNFISKMGGEGAQIAQQLSAAGFVQSTGNNSQAAQLWKQMANAGKIQQYEDAFGKEEYFGTAFRGIKSEKAKEMIRNSPTLQKALFSYSLQGQHGAYQGINRDFREGMSEQDLLLLMYNDRLNRAERNKNNHAKGLIKGLRNRLGDGAGSERNVALGMLKAEQQAKASGTFKNPAAAAQGQSPFTPQQQAEINANPTLQGVPQQGYPGGGGYVDIARQWAATDKGYDQNQRGAEGHFDCSSLVYRSTKAAGVKYKVPLSEFTTETMNPTNKSNVMRDAGFQWVQGTEGMKSGDILWKNGHTVIYSGNGNIIGAHGIKKYKNSGKMQDLLDSVSEKRLGDKGTYAGYWRYVGGKANIGGGAPAPQAASPTIQQTPKSQAPLQLPMIQRGQGPSAPPMALAMPKVEAPALAGMPYIPAAGGSANFQPPAGPAPRLAGGLGGGLSSVYAAMTANAMQRGVKYKLGARNSQTGLVDCSGWTIEMQKQVMQGIQDPAARARLGHVLAGGTAEGIIARGLKEQGGMSANLNPSQIKEGTMIGIKARKGGWGSDRAMGIGHIVTTFRDPTTGRMMVSESTSKGSGGRSGVITTDYEKWYNEHAGRTMWGVDTGALIGGSGFNPGNIKDQMAGAEATPYGMAGQQVQASQQGMLNEQASAFYASGGGGGNIDASTNITAGGGGKQGPQVEMVVNKDPMGWVVLQGNAFH